jgi:alkylation response protein AidB-like acyl-CoA dehydrogenase
MEEVLMAPLNSSQVEIAERTRSIAVEGIAPYAEQTDDRSEFPSESMEALREAGLLGLLVAQEHGGMGEGLATMAAVIEEIAKACSSTALTYLVHLAAGAAYAAAEPPRDDLLRAVASGDHLGTLALGEFGSRSHFWAPMSQIEAGDGKVILRASKAFVTGAGHVDGYVVLTRAADAEEPTDSILYYVPGDAAGVRLAGAWDALGLRGNASAPVVFEGVALSPSSALSPPGQGMQMLLDTLLPIINIGVAAICLGIAESSIEIVGKHIQGSRLEHLGLALADLPNERARLARMRTEADKARAHLSMVLGVVERESPEAMLMILESKVVAAEAALEVTDIAMKAAGGHAFNRKLGLERRFRDARAADFIGITGDMLYEFIGRAMCGMPVPA